MKASRYYNIGCGKLGEHILDRGRPFIENLFSPRVPKRDRSKDLNFLDRDCVSSIACQEPDVVIMAE